LMVVQKTKSIKSLIHGMLSKTLEVVT
jgi:hypothetical protein